MYTTPEWFKMRAKRIRRWMAGYVSSLEAHFMAILVQIAKGNVIIYGMQQDRRATFDKPILQLQPRYACDTQDDP